jgi:transcriptional regulator with XRE-family HTH domain
MVDMNISNELIQFGLHIKKLRISKKLTQEELAFSASLDRTYISGIERGKRNVSFINILKLASALDVHPNQLFNYYKLEVPDA